MMMMLSLLNHFYHFQSVSPLSVTMKSVTAEYRSNESPNLRHHCHCPTFQNISLRDAIYLRHSFRTQLFNIFLRLFLKMVSRLAITFDVIDAILVNRRYIGRSFCFLLFDYQVESLIIDIAIPFSIPES